MSHSTSGELTGQREEWFREIQEGLLWHVRDVPALGKDRLRDDLGEPRLIGSMLVARIAVQLARGESTATIRDVLAARPLFAAPGRQRLPVFKFTPTIRHASSLLTPCCMSWKYAARSAESFLRP